jgi:hypothetical protein
VPDILSEQADLLVLRWTSVSICSYVSEYYCEELPVSPGFAISVSDAAPFTLLFGLRDDML